MALAADVRPHLLPGRIAIDIEVGHALGGFRVLNALHKARG